MATENEILARQKEITERISTQVRTLAVSFLALVWLFLVPGKDGAPPLPHAVSNSLLVAAGATSIASMVMDFLQYFSAYLSVKHTLGSSEKDAAGNEVFEYDYTLLRYKAQTWLFWGKQIAIGASFVCLVCAFWVALGI